MSTQKRFAIAFVAASCFLAVAVPVRADSIFTVTVTTTALMSNSSGPFQIDFQLTDGSGTGDANNTANMTSFTFGGGAASGSSTTLGGASGDLSSTVTLVDSSFFNNFQQAFTAGTALSFTVDLTTNVDLGGTPDAFTFSILDGASNNITTSDPAGSLLTANINSTTPSASTFSGTGNYAGLTANVTVPTPEPGTLLLSALGLSAFALAFVIKRVSS